MKQYKCKTALAHVMLPILIIGQVFMSYIFLSEYWIIYFIFFLFISLCNLFLISLVFLTYFAVLNINIEMHEIETYAEIFNKKIFYVKVNDDNIIGFTESSKSCNIYYNLKNTIQSISLDYYNNYEELRRDIETFNLTLLKPRTLTRKKTILLFMIKLISFLLSILISTLILYLIFTFYREIRSSLQFSMQSKFDIRSESFILDILLTIFLGVICMLPFRFTSFFRDKIINKYI